MFRLRSHRVLRPHPTRCPSILLLNVCLLSHLHPPFLHPPPHLPPLLLLVSRVSPNLLLLIPIRRCQARSTPHKPPSETVVPPHSSPFHGTTPNWSCTPTYISRARFFCSLLPRSRDHQRSPRCNGTSAAHAAVAAWTLASRRRRRHVAMSDAARASLGVYGGCYRHPPLPS